MTSPATNPGTVASGAAHRCTSCGAKLVRVRALDPAGGDDVFVLHHPGICPGVTLELFRGPAYKPVGPVVIDTARDDRAGVTLPLELVGCGEPVPVGAGDGLGQADAGGHEVAGCGHKDSIAIGRADVTENCCADGSQRFAEVG